MTEDAARLDIGSALAPPGWCPGCGSAGLVAMTDGEQIVFACQPCGQCWQLELGWARRADLRNLRRVPDETCQAPGPHAGTVPSRSRSESAPADTGTSGDER